MDKHDPIVREESFLAPCGGILLDDEQFQQTDDGIIHVDTSGALPKGEVGYKLTGNGIDEKPIYDPQVIELTDDTTQIGGDITEEQTEIIKRNPSIILKVGEGYYSHTSTINDDTGHLFTCMMMQSTSTGAYLNQAIELDTTVCRWRLTRVESYPPNTTGTKGQLYTSKGEGAGEYKTYYIPDSKGTAGQVWTSNGNNVPSWKNNYAPNTVGNDNQYWSSNGNVDSWKTAYPPTSKGTAGQVWTSNGDGIPSWKNISTMTTVVDVTSSTTKLTVEQVNALSNDSLALLRIDGNSIARKTWEDNTWIHFINSGMLDSGDPKDGAYSQKIIINKANRSIEFKNTAYYYPPFSKPNMNEAGMIFGYMMEQYEKGSLYPDWNSYFIDFTDAGTISVGTSSIATTEVTDYKIGNHINYLTSHSSDRIRDARPIRVELYGGEHLLFYANESIGSGWYHAMKMWEDSGKVVTVLYCMHLRKNGSRYYIDVYKKNI